MSRTNIEASSNYSFKHTAKLRNVQNDVAREAVALSPLRVTGKGIEAMPQGSG